ncbi:MAG: helix-turn-helix transcriptional regulator [Dysgonamonadaceae bacterium]|nr:helix-turn-helix transcriptional regulator [Dysgonamonadaceae bacterium]
MKGQIDKVFVNVSKCILQFEDNKIITLVGDDENKVFLVHVTTSESRELDLREKVLKYYKNSKSLDNLAEKCGFNCTKTFTRHFQSTFNITPKQWILNLKEKEMIKYLKDTDYTLKQIAVLLNFSNQSQLSHFCIQRTGFTPKELRESK